MNGHYFTYNQKGVNYIKIICMEQIEVADIWGNLRIYLSNKQTS